MKQFLTVAAVMLVACGAWAQQGLSYSMPAIEAGFKWGSANQNGADSNKQDLAFQLGGSVVLNFSTAIGLRTGLFYSERAFKSEFPGGTTGEGKITYFEVPAHLMFKLEDYAGVYVGPSLAVKLGDEYSPGNMTDVKDMVVPLTFGAQFKFTPVLGLNVFFETVPGELANGIKNSRAVGVNLLIAMD